VGLSRFYQLGHISLYGRGDYSSPRGRRFDIGDLPRCDNTNDLCLFTGIQESSMHVSPFADLYFEDLGDSRGSVSTFGELDMSMLKADSDMDGLVTNEKSIIDDMRSILSGHDEEQ
jgi:hypothetical protein